MANSREQILKKLRAAQVPFDGLTPPESYLPMVPVEEGDLAPRFVAQAEKLGCAVYSCASEEAAYQALSTLLKDQTQILGWEFAHIPLPGLAEFLSESGISRKSERDEALQFGLTGVDAALASTGSLLVRSGEGKPRFASLLPPAHIAIVKASQILPNFEAWVAQKQAAQDFRAAANTVIISGPSRTADIAMQLILGMHGPEQLHIVLLNF